MSRLQFVAVALAVALEAGAQAPVIDSNVAVPMRDGVILRADVWRPARTGRFPTLVYRTPYDKRAADAALSTARKAVARGYAVVLQDVRGRYASDGEFLPYQQEGRDGFDTIEWAAAQPWSTGAIGTYGLSYPGAVQWLAAIESPPHLRAMVPAMTFASPMMFWYSGGVFDNSWIPWVWHNIDSDRRAKLGMPPVAHDDSTAERMRSTLPQLATKGLERTAPWYYDWLRHGAYDSWWNWAELRGKYGRTSAAVLSFSGWHDEAYGPHGATNNYAGLVAARGNSATAAMVIGPWTHGVPRQARTTAGDRDYTRAGTIDYDELVLRWMDRHVRGVDNGVQREQPVRVFVMGANRWIEADAWPIPGTRPDTLVLRRSADSTVIVSDPRSPITDPFADRYGAHDYRALATRTDVVVFETPPLERDLTVVGAMQAEIRISSDGPDTDIWVKVHDVAPDGTAWNLMSPGLDVQRASYRNARATRELLKPGEVYALRFNDLFTGNTFKAGHRVRVIVTTTFFPHFSRNLHSGELEASSDRSRTARITVHHSARHPARLILPVLP